MNFTGGEGVGTARVKETSGTPVGGGNSVAIAFQTTDRQTNKQIDIAVA